MPDSAMGGSSPDPPRDQTLELMRGLAIVGVLVIHTFYRFAEPGAERIAFALPALIARPCIALFLFCSGYFARMGGSTEKFRYRLRRLILPYLFFSLFAYPFKEAVGIPFETALIPLDLVLGNTMGIYYYVLVIFYIHLLEWLLSRKGILPKHLYLVFFIFLALNFLFTSLFDPLWAKFGGPGRYHLFIIWRSPFIWPCFFFLGTVARTGGLRSWAGRNRALLFWLWLAGAAAICLVFISGIYPTRTPAFLGYNSPLGTVYSLAAIFFLLTFNSCPGWLKSLSRLSYPVYLSHIFFVYTWRWLIREYVDQPSAWLGPLGLPLALAGSLGVYWLARIALGPRSKWVVGA